MTNKTYLIILFETLLPSKVTIVIYLYLYFLGDIHQTAIILLGGMGIISFYEF